MPIVRIEHAVPNFERWKEAFDRDPADRKGAGVRCYQVFRLQDDSNYAMVDLEFDSLGEAEVFLIEMRRIWDGPGKSIAQNPRARIVELLESKSLAERRDRCDDSSISFDPGLRRSNPSRSADE